MSSGDAQIVGYRYFMGMHMAFCHGPIDKIREIKVSDKVAWPAPVLFPSVPTNAQEQSESAGIDRYVNGRPVGSSIVFPTVTPTIDGSTTIFIFNPYLFGGDQKEGGIGGLVDFSFGGPTEPRNSYLAALLGPDVPAFRGVVSLIARRCYVASLNPYIKPWSIYAQRTKAQTDGSTQWFQEYATIGDFDMNPAHMLYELLTNPVYGKGCDPGTQMDDASFRAAALALYGEGFGLSTVWADTRGIEDFIKNILAHIDATLYQDRLTNRWKLRLGRDDYNRETLAIFDKSNILSIDELGRPLPSELINQVTLTYWNRTTRKNDTVIIDNSALQDAIGGQINPNDIDRTMIADTALAQRVAARELRTQSTSLLTGRMSVNRDGIKLSTADCFKLRLPSRGVQEVICRVMTINYGNSENPQIVVSFIEDIFSLPQSSYLVPNTTLWEDPRKQPAISLHRYIGELPYWTIVNTIGESQYETLHPESGYLALSGDRQDNVSEMYAWTQESGGTMTRKGRFAAAATARVPAAVGRGIETTVTLDQIKDAEQIYFGKYAVWDSELVQVRDFLIDSGSIKLLRGVLDTVPVSHSANSRIIFVDGHQYVGTDEFGPGETVQAKIITRNQQGELRLSAAPTDAYVFNSRHIRPYPPGAFQINGVTYPATIYGSATIYWSHRHRRQQNYMVSQDTGSIGPEPGTTYSTVIRRTSDGTIVRTVPGTTGTFWLYPENMDIADGGIQDVTFEVYSVRGGYNSWQSQSHALSRHGLGFQLGLELGGVAP